MRNSVKVAIGVAGVGIIGAGLGVWWFFSGDAPAPVSLDTATESVTAETGAASAAGIAGTWVVDTDTGSFDYESATGSFAGFRIREELSTIGSSTAVGRTGGVSGSITIEDTALTATTVEVDLATITTNESRRDDNVQDALETTAFPTAEFVLTEPVPLPDGTADGEVVSATALGELTLHGVTRTVEFAVEAQLVEDTVVVIASTDVAFADYDIEVPDSNIVLSVDDHGVLELQLLLIAA